MRVEGESASREVGQAIGGVFFFCQNYRTEEPRNNASAKKGSPPTMIYSMYSISNNASMTKKTSQIFHFEQIPYPILNESNNVQYML